MNKPNVNEIISLLKELAPPYMCECETEEDEFGNKPTRTKNMHGEYIWGDKQCRYCEAHQMIESLERYNWIHNS